MLIHSLVLIYAAGREGERLFLGGALVLLVS